MKTVYKVLLVIGVSISFSELMSHISTSAFIEKMNARSEANYKALEKFTAKSSHNLPAGLDIFKKLKDIKFNETLNFLHRSPTAKFIYGKKYEITIYRIDTSYNQKLNKTITESYINTDPSINIHFANDDIGYMQFYYNNSNTFPKPSNIYLNLYGTNTHTILKNDSIAYYYSNLVNTFIHYSINGPQDIYAKSTSDDCPIEIMLLKRNGALYLLFMTNRDHGYKLNPNLLYSLVAGTNQ